MALDDIRSSITRPVRRLPSARLRSNSKAYFNRTFHSLGNPTYRSFWLSLIALMAGMNMQMLARGQLAWELTGDTFMVAIVGSGFAPPILLFGLFGGTLADRLDRKKMIQFSQLFVSLGAGAVGVTVVLELINVWILLGAALLQGVCWSFMMPARNSIIPQLVEDNEVTNAVALNASGMALMTLSAPGIGGLVYAFFGAGATYFAISGLMFTAFVLTGFVKVKRPATAKKRRINEPMLRAVWGGLAYSAQNKTILILMLLVLATTMTSMSFRSLMPAQVEVVFGGGPTELGILMSMIGVGALSGSLFIAGLTENMRRGIVLLVATGISAIAMLASTFIGVLVIGAFAMVMLGVGDSGRRALNSALLMEQSEDEFRGRVMGLYMLNFGLRPLGAIPLGFLAEQTSVQTAFGVAGFVLTISVLLAWLLTPRIRRL